MPKVSVVIPAYNSMQFLPEAVNSVLRQTLQDFEIIVVNDGSTDNTEVWLSKLSDPRLIIVAKENGGLAAARNSGIAVAKGEYIAFLDADDLWESTKLEKQAICLDSRPTTGLVHNFIVQIDSLGEITSETFQTRGTGDVYKHILQENLVQCGSTPMVRRECFNIVGVFDPNLKAVEDWDMWIRIASKYDFAIVEEPLTFYRMHSTNMSKSYRFMLPYIHQVIEKAFSTISIEKSYLKKRAYGRTYLYSAHRAVEAGDYEESSQLLHQAIISFPRLRFSKNSIRLRLKLAKANWWKVKNARP